MTLAAAQHLQQRASDPASHVWVSASAGSGKTTVLVSRILRLLLSGVLPHRILCLTYTKAAAMEMRLRLSKELTRWATCEAASLQRELEKHTGTAPTQEMMERARTLFAIISDAPDALRIQTIHSFCQSILARFPIEANLSPGFTALDEYQATPFLRRAMESAWQENHSEAWQKAKDWCTANYSMTQLQDLLPGLMSEWPEISAVMLEIGEADYWAQSFTALDVPENEKEVWHNQLNDAALPMAALRAWLAAKPNKILADFLSLPEHRSSLRDSYLALFMTQKMEINKKFPIVGLRKIMGPIADELMIEAERLYRLFQKEKDQRLAAASAAMGIVLARVSAAYQLIKEQHGALDFNDLIQKTHQLLASRAMGEWVHYKLDGGIDHVLVDEAQDTAPLQWEVITRLVNEFFAGSGRSENPRSLFVVGDPKQSIYSFQGADARVFQHLRESYGQRATEADANWQDVPMQHSFRTSQNLLAVVDDVFAQPDKRVALQNTDDAIVHETIHDQRMGQIKIYPPVAAPPRQTFAGMSADEDAENEKHNALLARQIADQIKNWLTAGRTISSTQQRLQPKDILILLQQRTSMADMMLTALREENIPVLGNDRLKLLDAAAVQDVLSFCQFLLLPQDDLNLAQLLRSPLINMTDDSLEKIASGRAKGESLWQKLQELEDNIIMNYLAGWLRRADRDGAYATLAEILSLPCPASDISGWHAFHTRLGEECDDPMQELLQLALREGQEDAPLGLQNFVDWISQTRIEIKREMAQHHENAVRILTVHGAKGLEAPVVILADATEAPHAHGSKQSKTVKFNGHTPHFLFAPDKMAEGPSFDRSADIQSRAGEYQRLLYVAMTRAQHELHVFGKANSKGELKDHSWYPQILTATKNQGAKEVSENLFQLGAEDHFSATEKTTAAAKPAKQILPAANLPSIAGRVISVTQYLQQKYPAVMHQYADSHLAKDRGVIIHRLLELLPRLAPPLQKTAALRFISLQLPELPESTRDEWVEEIMRIIHTPELAPFFSAAARTEMSITGSWKNHALIGKVDCFYATDQTLKILDFKTTAQPPPRGEIPPQYTEQLQIYAKILAELYPNHSVSAGILWTANSQLDWLDAENLRLVA